MSGTTTDPAALRRRIEELNQSILQQVLNPQADLPNIEQISTFRAEHARLQDEVKRLRQRQQELVKAKAEFEPLDAAQHRTVKDLTAAENGLKQFARPLGKAAFEALVAGQLQNQPIFSERTALRDRLAELNTEYDQHAPADDAGLVQKTKAKAQQLAVAGKIKFEELKIGKLDEQIGSQLITSSQEQSVACDLTAEPLAALRKQRDLIARCKQESAAARAALEAKKQQVGQTLGMSSIESAKSFDAEHRKCETQIGQIESQRSTLEQQFPDQLLSCDLGQSNLRQLAEELRQAKTQWEATPHARTASDAFRTALAPSNAGAIAGQAKKPLAQVVTMWQGLDVKKKIVVAICGFLGLSVFFCCGISVIGKAVLPKTESSASTNPRTVAEGTSVAKQDEKAATAKPVKPTTATPVEASTAKVSDPASAKPAETTPEKPDESTPSPSSATNSEAAPTAALSPPIGARELIASVGSIGAKNDYFIRQYNACLKAVRCYASEDQLVIDFDCDTNSWQQVGLMSPLIVRIFDKNGEYLTHFITVEGFTALPTAYQRNKQTFDSYMNSGLRGEADKYRCILLKATGNRLVYGVNVRDLRDAAIVEIGFGNSK